MVTKQSVDEQLEKIHFNIHGWGRTEISELPNVLLPDEEIYECVNGIYEGGFSLLVATNVRVLLIDKKPMNFLTVEDLRFDMINEIDYNHRLIGAYITISTGYKDLKFTSFNKPRLRKLINHVQHCMAENKKKQSEHQEDQRLHLEQINRQLQTYLLAQHQQQQKMAEQLQASSAGGQVAGVSVEPPKPSPELSDYLYARSLLAQHQQQTGQDLTDSWSGAAAIEPPVAANDLYAEGMQEVFGRQARQPQQLPQSQALADDSDSSGGWSRIIAPLQFASKAVRVAYSAYSRLPQAVRQGAVRQGQSRRLDQATWTR